MDLEDSVKSKFDQIINQLHPQKRVQVRDDLRRLEVAGTIFSVDDFWARQRVDGMVIINDMRRLLSLEPSMVKQIKTEVGMIVSLFILITAYLLVTDGLTSPVFLIIVGIGGAGLAVFTARFFRAWWFVKPAVITLFVVISLVAVSIEIVSFFFGSIYSLFLLKVASALIISACVVLVFHLVVAIHKLLWDHKRSR